ncbi:MAG: CoA transferase [Trebonia sp.]
MTAEFSDIAGQAWRLAGSSSSLDGALTVTGPRAVLPAFFDVTGLATASVAAATLAAAEFLAARDGSGEVRPVTVDSRAACAAFACEGLFTPIGWSVPSIWDPIAGNYLARDGWIRLHTNYAYHRDAVERVLGVGEQDAVRAAVREWKAADLETAVVEAGGCAAAMRTRADWLASAAGAATAGTLPLRVRERAMADGGRGPTVVREKRPEPAGRAEGSVAPFAGVRVLDLTRVIAGPVCTRFLAAYGADVLRLDPPGFAEVPALLPETTAGKRTAAVDLTTTVGRETFQELAGTADVLVAGLRGDALARLGYDDAALSALNPALIIASLNAYGWDGPWRNRRGFDSLAQMSCGIAAAGTGSADKRSAGRDKPLPLPVQALDHATGFLLAAAVGRALTRRLNCSTVSRIHASLVGTANFLWSLPGPGGQPPMPGRGEFPLEDTTTEWGPARRVPLPGRIAGIVPGWGIEAGPLGRHEPSWARLFRCPYGGAAGNLRACRAASTGLPRRVRTSPPGTTR